MSEWAPPSSSDFPAQPTDGIDALLRRVEAVKRDLNDATNGLLRAAGITVSPTGMVVDSSLSVSGDLNATGDTTIGGNMVLTGTLSLPAGIIGNDALTSPLQATTGHASAATFSLATGPNVDKASTIVPVPAGFTQALVMASATMSAVNTTALGDTMFVGCYVDGVNPGLSTQVGVYPNYLGTATATATRLVTGLPSVGATVTITARASSGAANWSAFSSNELNLDAILLFLR